MTNFFYIEQILSLKNTISTLIITSFMILLGSFSLLKGIRFSVQAGIFLLLFYIVSKLTMKRGCCVLLFVKPRIFMQHDFFYLSTFHPPPPPSQLQYSQGLYLLQYTERRKCAADFSLLNLPKGKSLGRSKPATNS